MRGCCCQAKRRGYVRRLKWTYPNISLACVGRPSGLNEGTRQSRSPAPGGLQVQLPGPACAPGDLHACSALDVPPDPHHGRSTPLAALNWNAFAWGCFDKLWNDPPGGPIIPPTHLVPTTPEKHRKISENTPRPNPAIILREADDPLETHE